ncbi:xylose isomerase [Rhodoferax koreense]|uniref:Xylose isomerase n=2 Tax=Rhodoferax koreensis TaxID=1842727 RepID=A0A1P8K4I8_9BURK|nr:xylose isomerase [Rhodoferax koreense]
MPELSLHHLTMLQADPLSLIDAAAAGGFDYCGIRIVPPAPTDVLPDVVGNPALVREIDQRLRSRNVRLLDIEAIWLRPETDVAALVPALEVGHRLGARQVLVVGFDDDLGRLLDNFCKLCQAAARLQMSVALEFITYCTIGTLAQAHWLVQRSEQPNARLLIDALQFFRSGAKSEDLAAIDPMLLPYMQLCDGPLVGPVSVDERRVEARTARLLPGEGQLPLAGLLAALPKGIPISVEAPTLRLAHLPFDEQARIVGDATRKFFADLNSTI